MAGMNNMRWVLQWKNETSYHTGICTTGLDALITYGCKRYRELANIPGLDALITYGCKR